MNERKRSSFTREKLKPHHVPKMSTEAQIVLQEIRSVKRRSQEGTELATELQYLAENSDEIPNVHSSALNSTAINHSATKVPRLKDIDHDYPFVLTLPGFDVRYNMAALRPFRESPQEREKRKCIQKQSIAKCQEWLERT